MITYEDECVGCPPERGCRGASCPNRNVPHYYCDNCGAEEKLYYYGGKELCIDCIEQELEEVNYG